MLDTDKKVNGFYLYFVVAFMIIQIYEIQKPYEAEKLIAFGVDHIGSVLLFKDIWKISELKETIKTVQESGAKSVLIPLSKDPDMVRKALEYYRPDIVHFCEILPEKLDDPEMDKIFCLQECMKNEFPEIAMMRTIPVPESLSMDRNGLMKLALLFEPISDYFLTDTIMANHAAEVQPVSGFVGITGKTCNWEGAKDIVETSSVPVILAGGLTPDNVRAGIFNVCPAGVDSCTGTNAIDGNGNVVRFRKDMDKVKKFVEEIRQAETGMQKSGHLT